jgi:hypothetical protein
MLRRGSLALLAVLVVRRTFRRLGWPVARRRLRGGFSVVQATAVLKRHYDAQMRQLLEDDSPSPLLARRSA